MQIGFIGMTHLGLNYLAATARRKFNVYGVDESKNKIEQYKSFNFSISEPKLKKVIIQNKNKINFTSNFNDIKKLDLIFISLDVETDSIGKSKDKPLLKLIKKVKKYSKKSAELVILSQVKPGFTRNINFQKKKLYYQVETLVFGEAVERANKPERIIVGLEKKNTSLGKNYKKFLNSFKCPIIKMNYESAELTKITINIFLASSVTVSNTMARLCKQISADWFDIIPALKLDKRIGPFAYVKPGLGISGGNLERDLFTAKILAKKDKYSLNLINSFINNSKFMKNWVLRVINSEIKNKKIGIFGLTYKDKTNSIKNSPTIKLLKSLKKNKVLVFDPNVNLKTNFNNVIQVKNFRVLIDKCKILIFMTNWNNTQYIKKYMNKKNLKKTIIVDPNNLIDENDAKFKKHFKLGK